MTSIQKWKLIKHRLNGSMVGKYRIAVYLTDVLVDTVMPHTFEAHVSWYTCWFSLGYSTWLQSLVIVVTLSSQLCYTL